MGNAPELFDILILLFYLVSGFPSKIGCSMTRIQAFTPDFGRVLALFDHTRACDVLAQKAGMKLTGEDVRKLLFSGEDSLAKKHESGVLAPRDFFAEVRQLLALREEFDYEEFEKVWKEIFDPIPG